MFNWIRKKAEKDGGRAARPASASVVAGAHPASAQLKERGDVHLKAGRLAEAEACYREVLAGAAGHAEALVNLGFVLCAQGRGGEARGVLERALAVAPEDADAHYLLAGVLAGSGESAAAIRELQQAVALRAGFEPAYCDLIVQLYQARRLTEAVSCCEAGLAALPASAQLYFYRSNLYLEAGDRSAALAACQTALRLEPGLLAARQSASRLLFEAERLDEALASYRAEIELDPQVALAHHQAGVVLALLNRYEEAEEVLARAVRLAPQNAASHHERGVVLHKLDRLAEATSAYAEAVACAPGRAEYHYHLGLSLHQRGLNRAALAALDRAIERDPGQAEPRWVRAMAFAAPFSESVAAREGERREFARALQEFAVWWEQSAADGAAFVGKVQPFFLTYHEADNLELQKQHGALCARAMQRWFERQRFTMEPRAPSARLRIGIVSADIRAHSVWVALIQGWLAHLDRSRFEMGIFCLNGEQDAQTAWAKGSADFFVGAPQSLHGWVEAIRRENCAVLVYPAIGLEPLTLQLASLRLAPTQMNAWGHPDTSGLPTIDCYLSAEAFEPPGARQHYSETLITLPHLGNPYRRLDVVAIAPDWAVLGIDPARPLLICPGSPFKYQPDYDPVLVALARRLPAAQLVMFRPVPGDISERLEERLTRAFDEAALILSNHVRFLPWQSLAGFHGLMRHADALLDSIGFSGYNNVVQAIECGLPPVTLEGRFLRGRLGSGILRRLEMPELIASSAEEYVEIVLRLVEDDSFARRCRQQISDRQGVLFDDVAPIAAFEELLVSRAGS